MPQDKEAAMLEIKRALKKAVGEKESSRKWVLAAVAVLALIVIAVYFIPQIPITPPITPPVSPSCSNGVQDRGEQGVDCGGTCFGECVSLKDPGYTLPSTVYDVAVDKEDRILIADKDRDRIMVFSPELKYLRNIGETGVQPGGASNAQLANPLAVGVSPVDGKIFISDEFNLRIQVFDSKLNYSRTIKEKDYGITGAFYCLAVTPDNKLIALSKSHSALYIIGDAVEKKLDTGLSSPEGCAAAPDGRIFVADSPNHVVKVFNASLQQVGTIGSDRGNGEGQFNWPTGVAVDKQGNVYVADSENKRVQVFNPDYSFKAEIKGGFEKPTKVAVDSKGRIIVGDVGAAKVFVFNPSLVQVGVLEGLTRPEYGLVYFTPRYVAVAPNGTIFASEEVNQRVVVLNSDFSFKDVLGGSLGAGNNQFFSPLNMAVDKQGNLYVADKDNHRVQVFDSSMRYLKTIGSGRGNGNTEFNGPRSIAIDSAGRIFVVDKGNNRVQVFSPSGDYLATIKSGGGYSIASPEPVAVDAADNIYVANTHAATILVFDKELNYVKTIEAGEDLGELEGGMVVDGKGRIVVVGITSGKIRMIDTATGAVVKTAGGYGNGNGKFNWPGGITIIPNGNFIVADEGNFRLQVLDPELNFVKVVSGGSDLLIETSE